MSEDRAADAETYECLAMGIIYRLNIMQQRKNLFRWSFALALGGMAAAAWGLWKAWPRERLLLELSTHVSDQWITEYRDVWVSDHEIVKSDVNWPISAANPAKMVHVDFQSGRNHLFPIKQCPVSTHAYMLPSPDGRWALCCDSTAKLSDKITAVELQTGRSLTWPVNGDRYHYGNCWMADSRRWLQYTTLPDGYLTIHSVDHPKQSIRLSFPNYNAEKFRNEVVTASDHLLTLESSVEIDDQSGPPWSGLDIHEYRLLPSIALLRTLHVSSPPGVTMRSATVSPDGDHIVWSCSQSYVSPIAVWLHRWIKRVPATPQLRYGLWVSRLDGSHPHEIGHISQSPDDEYPNLSVHWLPDNRHVSFVYKGSLYTVPAETGP